jgi:hypothetical protein
VKLNGVGGLWIGGVTVLGFFGLIDLDQALQDSLIWTMKGMKDVRDLVDRFDKRNGFVRLGPFLQGWGDWFGISNLSNTVAFRERKKRRNQSLDARTRFPKIRKGGMRGVWID